MGRNLHPQLILGRLPHLIEKGGRNKSLVEWQSKD